jgi:hypothetical protein
MAIPPAAAPYRASGFVLWGEADIIRQAKPAELVEQI